jgi:pSer/pThr/pTyr-binding forkhead associated (FHA) protein
MLAGRLGLSVRVAQTPVSYQFEAALLCLGALALLAGVVFTVFWFRRRIRDSHGGEDDFPTEIASLDRSAPQAFLLAEEDYRTIPSRIELYRGIDTTIGRDSHACTIPLNDVGISRRHAKIISRQGRFYLRDSRSRGGTFLYRKSLEPGERRDRPRLSPGEERLLGDGDVIKFYTFAYRFQEGEATIIHDDHVTESGG